MPPTLRIVIAACVALFVPLLAAGEIVLVEAESFTDHGGWKLDTQFIQIMGSPYLLAHGLGQPVDDATTTVTFPTTGKYRVFVRTKDWVARWNAPGQPGRFQLLVDGKPLAETFGTRGAEWSWHDGGTVEIDNRETKIALHDLTGFDGRCDAVLLTTDAAYVPPNTNEPFAAWRKQLLGLPARPEAVEPCDVVIIGGGYAGMGTAIGAARMGCTVVLVQDRPVLGGNGSSEVRVWANGLIRRGKYPHIGEMVQEFEDNATQSPGTKEEFGDELKEKVVRAEPNIALFLNHHAYKVEMDGERIAAVYAFDTRTGAERRFEAKLFADCTGHGTIGYLAGADYEMTREKHMGMSNMWRWEETDQPQAFPEITWALNLEMDDFPYPKRFHGPWFWETGFDKDPIADLEYMRDWNLRAVYGAFNAMKNRGGKDEHQNARLAWIAYIGGPRESRRLLGDVVLTEEDIVNKKQFPDGCVPSTWSIDLHYPKEQYAQKFPDDPFISKAVFDHRVDRDYGYPVPYRCFYSRNVPNLFMAGRNISVTHEALGTVRVMKTLGMVGEVAGKAASICVQHDCLPRDVYRSHWEELDELLKLPGRARRQTVTSPIEVTGSEPPPPWSRNAKKGVDPRTLPGIVVDNLAAVTTGKWSGGTGLDGYIGEQYLYTSDTGAASIRFEFRVPTAGLYEVRFGYRHHENRATNVPVKVISAAGEATAVVNQKREPPLDKGFVSLGRFEFAADKPGAVVVGSDAADGTVCADAIQVLPASGGAAEP